jgi:transposase
MLAHVAELEADLAAVSERIGEHIAPFRGKRELLVTILGVGKLPAEIILAEIGPDMTQFRPPGTLRAGWICPGRDESAGKRNSGKTARVPRHCAARSPSAR